MQGIAKTKKIILTVLFIVVVALGLFVFLSSMKKKVQENFDKEAWFTAIDLGKIDYVKRLLDNGLPATIVRKDGWSSLRVAIASNSFNIAKMLAEQGADTNEEQHANGSLLKLAVLRGDSDLVTLLLKHGVHSGINKSLGADLFNMALNREDYDVAAELAFYSDVSRLKWNEWVKRNKLKTQLNKVIKGKYLDSDDKHLFGIYCYVEGRMSQHKNNLQQALKLYKLGFNSRNFMSRFRLLELLTNKSIPTYNLHVAQNIESRRRRVKHLRLPNAQFYSQQIERHNSFVAKWIFSKRYRDRKSTRLNSSHTDISRMPSSA